MTSVGGMSPARTSVHSGPLGLSKGKHHALIHIPAWELIGLSAHDARSAQISHHLVMGATVESFFLRVFTLLLIKKALIVWNSLVAMMPTCVLGFQNL